MTDSLQLWGLQHARLLCPSLSSRSLLKFMSIELVMLSNHLILCHPLLLLPSTFFSIKVFSNESALCIRWLKYWSFSFSISPSNEYSRLVSFRIDAFDLFAVQGTLKSLLQLHNWKRQFFGTQPSIWSSFHICTWLLENHALTIWTFVSKMVSDFVITFLPWSKHLLISRPQSPSSVI